MFQEMMIMIMKKIPGKGMTKASGLVEMQVHFFQHYQ